MFILLTILAEFILVSLLIIGFYRLKPRFGLVPLFVLVGSNQFFQTILATSYFIKITPDIVISPGAIILFSASFFTILLVYIKEGVFVTQRLIVGIILANLTFTVLAWITNQQFLAVKGVDLPAPGSSSLFQTNSRVFIVGTIVLLLDAFIIVILYEYFFVKQKWLNLYSRLLLTMLLVLNFDAVVFTIGSFWDKPGLENRLISQLVGKSVAAFLFATVLWIYLRYLDKNKKGARLQEEYGKEDILSILTYRNKYERLVSEKAISDEQLQRIIATKTQELEKSVRRFTILSSARELRMDKFSSSEQAQQFIEKVQKAFEVDACTIHQLNGDKLYLLASVGTPVMMEEQLLSTANPHLQKIITQKETLIIEDTRRDKNEHSHRTEGFSFINYISCVGIPMLSGSIVTGVLKLYSIHHKRIFTPLEIEHLQLVASQFAHLQENALLFEQNEKHKEVLVKQIMARKKAEEEIIREKELSDSLINSLPGVFYLYNEEGKFFRWNKNFETVTGYSSEEMSQKHPLDFFGGDEKSLLENKIKNVFKTGEDKVAASFIDKQGNKTPYFFTGKMINYEGIKCLMGVGIDISERVKAEEALIKSEERFRTLVEQASDGIFIANPFYQYILVNKSGCKMLGYTMEELLQMSVTDITFRNENDLPFRFQELKEGKSVIQERLLKHKNGSLIPVEISAKMLFNGDLLAFVRDISDRKRYQETLEKSERKLRQVLTSITDIFYVIDRNYQITLMNKTANELLTKAWGTTVFTGKNILELIPKGSDEPVNESFKKAFSGLSVEYEHYHSSPELEGWFLVNYHPVISDEGTITGAYVVTKDITERKKVEQQVISYNQQLRDLAAHLLSIREEERRRIGREIHDDLGQQLTAIKMDVAWIDKKIQDEVSPVKGKLKNIITLLDGSNQSVRRILNELKPNILDEYGLLDALEWHSKQFTDSTGIPVEIHTSKPEIKLSEDIATCIFRVCQESLTNIARHSGAKNVLISLDVIEENIVVVIEDDGKGFDVNSALKKGTFGLLGMNERVRSLNGTLDINSIPGNGTTILMKLRIHNNN